MHMKEDAEGIWQIKSVADSVAQTYKAKLTEL